MKKVLGELSKLYEKKKMKYISFKNFFLIYRFVWSMTANTKENIAVTTGSGQSENTKVQDLSPLSCCNCNTGEWE